MRLIPAGIIATVCSLPFAASKIGPDVNPPKPNSTPPAKNLILTEQDFDGIQILRRKPPNGDYRLQEKLWVDKTYPTTREALIALYTAEAQDIKALREGKISEKDRQVKLYLASHVKVGEEGEDMSRDSGLLVIKKYVNSKINKVTYVIEGWPTTRTGDILPPETWRVRVQAFGKVDDLYGNKEQFREKRKVQQNFIFDKFEGVWNTNNDNSKPGTDIYASLARQYFNGKDKEYNQTQTIVRSPYSCSSCHGVTPNNHHTHHLFHNPERKIINFGAITQDYMFDLPYNQHKGFLEFQKDLSNLVKQEVITQKYSDNILNAIQHSSNFENKYFVQTLKETSNIPWVESDIKDDTEAWKDPGKEGFTYMQGNDRFRKAIYDFYRPTGIGEWWKRDSLKQISGCDNNSK